MSVEVAALASAVAVHAKHDGSRDKECRDATLALVIGGGTLVDNRDGENSGDVDLRSWMEHGVEPGRSLPIQLLGDPSTGRGRV